MISNFSPAPHRACSFHRTRRSIEFSCTGLALQTCQWVLPHSQDPQIRPMSNTSSGSGQSLEYTAFRFPPKKFRWLYYTVFRWLLVWFLYTLFSFQCTVLLYIERPIQAIQPIPVRTAYRLVFGQSALKIREIQEMWCPFFLSFLYCSKYRTE